VSWSCGFLLSVRGRATTAAVAAGPLNFGLQGVEPPIPQPGCPDASSPGVNSPSIRSPDANNLNAVNVSSLNANNLSASRPNASSFKASGFKASGFKASGANARSRGANRHNASGAGAGGRLICVGVGRRGSGESGEPVADLGEACGVEPVVALPARRGVVHQPALAQYPKVPADGRPADRKTRGDPARGQRPHPKHLENLPADRIGDRRCHVIHPESVTCWLRVRLPPRTDDRSTVA